MKKIWMFLFVLLFPSCKEAPPQPRPSLSQITAYVHWENQALEGKQIQLVQTGETKLTDSKGMAEFSVPGGKYTIRAYNINAPGPAPRSIDFNVEIKLGEKTTVDIIDCLPCM